MRHNQVLIKKTKMYSWKAENSIQQLESQPRYVRPESSPRGLWVDPNPKFGAFPAPLGLVLSSCHIHVLMSLFLCSHLLLPFSAFALSTVPAGTVI